MFTILIQCCDPEEKGCEVGFWMESGGHGEDGFINFRIDEGWVPQTFGIVGEEVAPGVSRGGDQAGLRFICPACAAAVDKGTGA